MQRSVLENRKTTTEAIVTLAEWAITVDLTVPLARKGPETVFLVESRDLTHSLHQTQRFRDIAV